MGIHAIVRILPNLDILGKNTTDRLVLMYIAARINDQKGYCFPTTKRIYTELGMSRRNLFYSLKRLKRLGVLEIIHKFGRSYYYLKDEEFLDSIPPCRPSTKSIIDNDVDCTHNIRGNKQLIEKSEINSDPSHPEEEVDMRVKDVQASVLEKRAKSRKKGTIVQRIKAVWFEHIPVLYPELMPLAALTGKEIGFIKAFERRVGSAQAVDLFEKLICNWDEFRLYCDASGAGTLRDFPTIGAIAAHAQDAQRWSREGAEEEELQLTTSKAIKAKRKGHGVY